MRAMVQLLVAFVLVQLLFAAVSTAQHKGDPAAGKMKYDSLCVGCHGSGGKGDGAAAAALNPKPGDLTNPDYMRTVSDQYLFEIIRDGGSKVQKSPLMPGWLGALNEKDIWNVVAYIRTLSAPKRAQ